MHTLSALNSYPHILAWILSTGSIFEWKCSHYFMVEADGHLKLLPAFILDIYKVFEHIDMLSIGIR